MAVSGAAVAGVIAALSGAMYAGYRWTQYIRAGARALVRMSRALTPAIASKMLEYDNVYEALSAGRESALVAYLLEKVPRGAPVYKYMTAAYEYLSDLVRDYVIDLPEGGRELILTMLERYDITNISLVAKELIGMKIRRSLVPAGRLYVEGRFEKVFSAQSLDEFIHALRIHGMYEYAAAVSKSVDAVKRGAVQKLDKTLFEAYVERVSAALKRCESEDPQGGDVRKIVEEYIDTLVIVTALRSSLTKMFDPMAVPEAGFNVSKELIREIATRDFEDSLRILSGTYYRRFADTIASRYRRAVESREKEVYRELTVTFLDRARIEYLIRTVIKTVGNDPISVAPILKDLIVLENEMYNLRLVLSALGLGPRKVHLKNQLVEVK